MTPLRNVVVVSIVACSFVAAQFHGETTQGAFLQSDQDEIKRLKNQRAKLLDDLRNVDDKLAKLDQANNGRRMAESGLATRRFLEVEFWDHPAKTYKAAKEFPTGPRPLYIHAVVFGPEATDKDVISFITTVDKQPVGKRVSKIKVVGLHITDAALQAIASEEYVASLDISQAKVTNKALIHFLNRNKATLGQLFLQNCENITDDCIPALLAMPKLWQLNIEGTAISSDNQNKIKTRVEENKKKQANN